MLSPANTPRNSIGNLTESVKKLNIPAADPKMAEAMEFVRSYQGPEQFVKEFDCRYCGFTRMSLLGKSLNSNERRRLASQAVQAIGELKLKQMNLKLRITDKGIGGRVDKKQLFFEGASAIQYLLAGRKASKTSQSTYVLVFAQNSENPDPTKGQTLVHLLRFARRGDATNLYHAVHRMIRDNMFSNLFDIHTEEDQKNFSAESVLHDDSTASKNVEKFIAESLMLAMDKIDALLVGNEGAIASGLDQVNSRAHKSTSPYKMLPGSPKKSRRVSNENVNIRRSSQSNSRLTEYVDLGSLSWDVDAEC